MGGDDSTVAMAPLAPTVVSPMATSVMPMQTTQFPPPTVEPPRHGPRAWLVALLVVVVLVIAAGVVYAVVHSQNSGTASCVTGTPRIKNHKVENDMRHLEQLICHS
jgi:hypothetical protein